MQNAKNKQNLESNKLCEDTTTHHSPTILKKDTIKNALQSYKNKTQTAQKVVELELNERFKKNNIQCQFHRQRFNELVNDKCSNLRLHEGLVLASVLNTFMSEFINDNILKLGDFDIKLIQEPDDTKRIGNLLELEKKNPYISRIYSTFPSHSCSVSSPQVDLINQDRLIFFQTNNTYLHEFYMLENVLNFLFSPISSITNSQRIDIIDKFLSVFDNNKNNKLYFFTNSYYLSNIQLFCNDALIQIDIPCSHHVLLIKHKVIFNEIEKFIQSIPLRSTTPEESLDLLKYSKKLLQKNHVVTYKQVQQFYKKACPYLKKLL